ncbi:hypothetical protein [Euzebya rosea]|uniref:hypothetical protein n=1 Tax=Euzebya rosea TaxID=2052804 RepID=UPI000D3E737B|nr:hypothetical protein [Euzebya rosea]
MSSTGSSAGSLDAPQLRETADIWWDSGTDPRIAWDGRGRRFWLVDGVDAGKRLTLLELHDDPAEPAVIAAALRDGLAACDFPPTADGVAPARAAATLRAAGLEV